LRRLCLTERAEVRARLRSEEALERVPSGLS
jgi:hypothetical protein